MPSLRTRFAQFSVFLLLLFAASPSVAQSEWVVRATGPFSWLFSASWNGTQWVAVGDRIETSPDGVTWIAQTPGNFEGWLRSVAWNGTQWATVGYGGTILTSPDGLSWTAQVSGTTQGLNSISWNGTLWMAVGNGGTILTSLDAVTWTAQTSGTAQALASVKWNGALWAAVGNGGTILTSSDGITWVLQTSGTARVLNAVAWNGTQWVSVGLALGFDGLILTSADGVTWTPQISGSFSYLKSVTWTGSLWVVVGDRAEIIESADGVNWSPQVSGRTVEQLWSVSWGDGQLVTVGEGIILGSIPAQGTPAPSNLQYPASTLVFPQGGDTTLAPSLAGGSTTSFRVNPGLPAGLSLDPVTGTLRGLSMQFSSPANYTVVAENIGGAASRTLSIRVASPPDAPNTVTSTAGSAQATVAWNSPGNDGGAPITGYTVVASPGGSLCAWVSGPLSCTVPGLTNGTSYSFQVTATNMSGSSIASSASPSVTVGRPSAPLNVAALPEDGRVKVAWDAPSFNGGSTITGYLVTASPGGATCAWTFGPLTCTVTGLTNETPYVFSVTAYNNSDAGAASMPSAEVVPAYWTYTPWSQLNSVAWDGVQWVAVGEGGVILTSFDGVAWASQVSGTDGALISVSTNGNLWVAVGHQGVVLTSRDGITWSLQTPITNMGLVSIAWNGSTWVAVGNEGIILTSADGAAWSERYSTTHQGLLSVGWNGSMWVTAGTNGALLTSFDGIVWTSRISGTSKHLKDISWDGTLWAVLGLEAGSNDVLLTSPDGIAWTTHSHPVNNGAGYGLSVSWDGAQRVAVSASGLYLTSSDGVTWVQQPQFVPSVPLGLAWGNGQYTAVGIFGIGRTTSSLHPPAPANLGYGVSTMTFSTQRDTVLAPSSSGGPVVRYLVVPSFPPGLSLDPATGILRGGQGMVVTPGANYTITAYNIGGSSARVLNIALASPPEAPTGALATAGNKQATVTWTAPLSDGGAVITAYTVTASPGGATCVWTSGPLACIVTNLVNDSGYTFTVTATNAAGTGEGFTTIAPKYPTPWDIVVSGSSQTLNAVSWNNARWVAVGNTGTILTSEDGAAWTPQTSGTTQALNSIAWNGSFWTAVGNGTSTTGGTNSGIRTSPDGITWTAQNSGTTQILRSVAWNGLFWTAVGNGTSSTGGTNSGIRTSPDGVTWTARTSGTILILRAVAWNGSLWVAVGAGTSGTGGANSGIRTSPDGITWTPRTSGTTQVLNSVSWGNGGWVAVGSGGTVLTSPDGIIWTTRTSGTTLALNSVSWNGTRWVTLGVSGTNLTSADGITWAGKFFGVWGPGPNSVAWGHGQNLTVGAIGLIRSAVLDSQPVVPTNLAYGTSTLVLFKSRDTAFAPTAGGGPVVRYMVSPTLPSGLSLDPVTGVIRGIPAEISSPANYTVVGENVTGATSRILNISTILETTPGAPVLRAIAPGNAQATVSWSAPAFNGGTPITGYAVVASPGGATCSWTSGPLSCTVTGLDVGTHYTFTVAAANSAGTGSPSAELEMMDWTVRASGTEYELNAVSWNGSQWLSVGVFGLILSSPDGVTWRQTTATNRTLMASSWDGTQWVTVGNSGTIVTSTDGLWWTGRAVVTFHQLNSVSWNGSQWVTVGDYGTVLSSPDGVTWSVQSSGTTEGLNSVSWIGTQWVTVGARGTILTSPDGVTWTARTSNTTAELYSVAWNGSTGLAGGAGGNLLTSPDGSNWTVLPSLTSDLLRSVVWDGTQWRVLGTSRILLSSPDGAAWTLQGPGPTSGLNGLAVGQNQLLAVGKSGEIRSVAAMTSSIPAFTYSTPMSYDLGMAIAPLSPAHMGTLPSTWSISPALPAGLSFNAANGAITGTPSAVTMPTGYTIIGTNADGADTAVVSIATPAGVPNAPTGLTVLPGNGKIFADWTASSMNGGAAITGYTVTATPGGANCLWSTGPLTCTVTGLNNGTEYTLTVAAGNRVGSGNASEGSVATPGPAPSISYAGSPYSFSIGSPVEVNKISSGVPANRWRISPNLTSNTGLLLNPYTGQILGTPVYATVATNYTITSTDSLTGTTDRLTISIATPAVAPNILYATPQSYPIGSAITELNPSNSGGGVGAWVISPNLNAATGLVFSTVTGRISGTPVYGAAAADYQVIANGFGGTADTAVVNLATVSVPPDIAYAGGPFNYSLNSAILELVPTSAGAPAAGWSISPNLSVATGLSFNPTTGRISGTPVYGSSATVYRVVATARGGATDTAVVQIATTTPAPTVSYDNTPLNYPVGLAIAPLVKTGTTGLIGSYSISPPLPSGLVFSTTTGRIEGAPTVVSAPADYILTAHGPGGMGSDTVNIQTSTPVPTVSYDNTPRNYPVGVTITPLVKTGATGIIGGYSVSPALPEGLLFSTTTGRIEGAPTVAVAAAGYVITAHGPGGTGSDTVSIRTSTSAPTVSYDNTPRNYALLGAITPFAKTGATGIISGYAVAPALPAGLVLSTSTGAIAGTPTALSPMTDYVITATGPGGTAKDTVSITVTTAAPTVSYDNVPLAYTVAVAIIPVAKLGATGVISGYSVVPPLPAGLVFSSITGAISGTPTAAAAATDYVVTVTGPGGSGRDTLLISVVTPSPTVSYANAPLSFPVGVAIPTVAKFAATGIISGYSVTPALPAGLSISASTGKIDGNPSVAIAATNYVISATGPGGTGKDTVNITTTMNPPVLSFAAGPYRFVKNAAVTAFRAENVGGPITGWSIGNGSNGASLTANTGLVFSTATGKIQGTPVYVSPARSYVVTANGLSGASDTETVSIAVTLVAKVAGDESFSFRVSGRAMGYNLRMPKIDESTENVTVTISDLSGRKVWSQWVDPRAGLRELEWNGRDQNGRPVAGGMYLVRVSATGAGQTSTVTNKAVALDR